MKKKFFAIITLGCFSMIFVLGFIETIFKISLLYLIPKGLMFYLLGFVGIVFLAVFLFINKKKVLGVTVTFLTVICALPLLPGSSFSYWMPEVCELISPDTQKKYTVAYYDVMISPEMGTVQIHEPIIPYIASQSAAFSVRKSSEPIENRVRIDENADEIVISYYVREKHCVNWIFVKEKEIWIEI